MLPRSSDAEAHAHLTELARERFEHIAPERIADHVLAITEGADWPVRRAAMEALARRFGFARRDELRVLGRVPRSSALGAYRTASRGSRARPYTTTILSVAPLRTSCDCADFLKGSLGLCKHGLVVLDALERSGAMARTSRDVTAPDRATLRWDPIQPLSGSADRLARLRWIAGPRSRRPHGFQVDGSPSAPILRAPEPRLALLTRLQRALDADTVDAEPSVRLLLRQERDRAVRQRGRAARARAAMKALSTLSRSLYPYQVEGVSRFIEAGRLLLADDMGLGKTTQAIAACHVLLHARAIRRGLLIVPAALKHQWRREWGATSDAPLTLVEGSPEERARTYAEAKEGFLIIGYEQLLRDLADVRRFAPELVVLDEGQRIKNWATKSAAYVKSLTPLYRLVLTGTPMENRLDELASIVEFVDEHALEPRWRLAPYHSEVRGDASHGVAGARNLGVLRERLSGVMMRRVRQDVLTQLPPRTDTRVPVELTEVQRTHHEERQQPIAAILQRASRRPLTQPEFLRLMQLLTQQRMICNGLAQLHFDGEWPQLERTPPSAARFDALFTPKLPVLRALIEQVALTQRRKVVVFSQWRNMLRLAEWSVRDLLAEHGMRPVFFTGAESSKMRERAIVDFHDDAAVTVMFLSDAGGVGLNLQRAASCCINLEVPWNPAVLEQRIGRIYRLGQTAPIDVYNLVCEEGIEAHIAQVVARKKALFSTLFDGTSDEVQFDGSGSFLETVRAVVEPVEVPEAEEESQEEVIRAAVDDGAHHPHDPHVEAAPEPVSTPPPPPPPPPPTDALRALAGLSMERRADGSVHIHAPPEAAAPLAELFETLARALRSQAGSSASSGAPRAE